MEFKNAEELADFTSKLENEHEKLQDDYRIAKNEISLLNMTIDDLKEKVEFNKSKFEQYFIAWKDLSKHKHQLETRFKEHKEDLESRIAILTHERQKFKDENKELREQVKFHKQKYDMAIATPTHTADLEEEIKQLKDKVVLWKKDAEKSKEEAQGFRESMISESNKKEKYRHEHDVMRSFYVAEKERAKKAETEKARLEERLKLELDNSAYLNEKCVKAIEEIRKEKENSEYFSEKAMKCNEDIKRKESELTWVKRELEAEISASKILKSIMNSKESEIRKLKDEVQKWKNAYSEQFKSEAEKFSAVLSESQIVTGTHEVAEEFKLPEVFAVMKCKAEDPELFSNPTKAIQRAEELNKENEPYSASIIRIIKVK